MKLLLVSISMYLPSYTGATKANRTVLTHLAALGHECQAVTGLWHSPKLESTGAVLRSYLGEREIEFEEMSAHETAYTWDGVQVHALDSVDPLRRCVEKRIGEFSPDWIFVSSGEPSDFLLDLCLKVSPEKVIYIAHATLVLPFGPGAFNCNARRTSLLKRVKGIIAPSLFVQRYIRQWANIDSFMFRFPVYGRPPYPAPEHGSDKLVTIINPCAVKGISIFEELARELPQLQFGAVPTWGTVSNDKHRLASLQNVQLLEPSENIDDIFSRVRILLVPSLWDEAFGQVAVEAMLRGIPVVASDVGGLPEASLGVAQIIPVRRIQEYQKAFDERYMPVPCLPPQAIEPWKRAVLTLTTDAGLHQSLSARSREAALKFVKEATVDKLEHFLLALEAKGNYGWAQAQAGDLDVTSEAAD